MKIYHLSFFRYLYYSKPFLAYYASFHVLTCIIHSLNERKKLNITPLSRFSFFDDIFLSAVKQLKSLVKVFLEKMLRTKERLLGNLRPLRRSHQRYCNRTQLSISPFFPEFHLRSQHCSLETRENELRERIPVPHENYLKCISSSRPCCEGYFCLLFSWPSHLVYFHANVTCFATKHLKFDNRYSYKGAKGLSCWHVFDQRVSLTIPGLYGETRPKERYLFQASGLWIKGRDFTCWSI